MNHSTTITVLIDSREQYPLLFPATFTTENPHRVVLTVNTRIVKLDAGDYKLADCNAAIFERKGSQLELIKNFFDFRDSIRTAKAFTKLIHACPFPYLLVEVSPQSLLDVNQPFCDNEIDNPQLIVGRLATVCAKYGLRLILTPKPASPTARRALGTLVLSLLLAHSQYATEEQELELITGESNGHLHS